ncbi:MAG: hypothetical protein NXI24_22835 [bacterium]|nr:hypothetical protein [bacterium]
MRTHRFHSGQSPAKRLAGIPAVLTAILLTVNCCGGPGALALDWLAADEASPEAGHCAQLGERIGHHEKPDEKPTTPAQPEHGDCPGCDLPPVVHFDSQKTAHDPLSFLKGSGEGQPPWLELSRAFFWHATNQTAPRLAFGSNSESRFRWTPHRTNAVRLSAAVPLYLDIQTFLI